MAIVNVGTTRILDAGPNTLAGPIWIKGIVCPGSVTIKDSTGTTTIMTLTTGVYDNLELRDTKGLQITGACTVLTKVLA